MTLEQIIAGVLTIAVGVVILAAWAFLVWAILLSARDRAKP
jgi:hypothetical protein